MMGLLSCLHPLSAFDCQTLDYHGIVFLQSHVIVCNARSLYTLLLVVCINTVR